MAGGHSDYVKGTMPVDGHNKTFDGFWASSKFMTAVITAFLLMPILVFCTPMTWFPALIVNFVVGIVIGVGLKLGAGWYGALIAITGVLGLTSIVISLIA